MENLRNIVENHLPIGIVLMDLVYHSSSDSIKVTIDSPSNISVGETSTLAKRIKNDDSILSMFPNGCRVEVTTPGIGSDLVERFQYDKNIGRKIMLEYYDDDDDESSTISNKFLIVDVVDKGVIVSRNEKKHLIMFKDIISAKIKVSFD